MWRGSNGVAHRLKDIHRDVVKQGSEKDHHVSTTLVSVNASCGLLTKAQHISEELLEKNKLLWNESIEGYAKHECYQGMQSKGVPPDAATLFCSLKA